MKYKNQTLTQYLNDLSAKLPAPGGGSAAALAGALGAALLSMVVKFTLGKPRYAPFEKELTRILGKAEASRKELLELADADIAAYLSKNAAKSLGVPLAVARSSAQAISLCPPLAKKGNINLISDVAVAAALLEAAFTSAVYNVQVNLKNLPDPRRGKKICKELEGLRKIVLKARKTTEERVGKVIRG
jgi:methenyltetrahydrofolate cyclohydrolase